MTETFDTVGHVTQGRLDARDRARLKAALAGCPDGDVRIRVEVLSARAKRTLHANKYLWVILTLMAYETGDTKEIMHDRMCERFLSYTVEDVDRQTGVVTARTLIKGTSRLTPTEFAAFVDQVQLFAQEWLGLELPSREAA